MTRDELDDLSEDDAANLDALAGLVRERARPLSPELRARVLDAALPPPRRSRLAVGIALLATAAGVVLYQARSLPPVAPPRPDFDDAAAAVAPWPVPPAAFAYDAADLGSETFAALAELEAYVANNTLSVEEKRLLARDLVEVANLESGVRAALANDVKHRLAAARKRNLEMNERLLNSGAPAGK